MNVRKSVICAATLLLFQGGAAMLPAQARNVGGPPFLPPRTNSDRAPDRLQFEQRLSRFAAFEVDAARIALRKSRRQRVRNLARDLRSHGQIVLAGIRAAAIKRGGRAPGYQESDRQTEVLDHLRYLGEPYFSVHYVQRMIAAYEMARRHVTDYARFGRDKPERNFAQTLLPRLNMHLHRLQRLETKPRVM